jgi:hypothetical protein
MHEQPKQAHQGKATEENDDLNAGNGKNTEGVRILRKNCGKTNEVIAPQKHGILKNNGNSDGRNKWRQSRRFAKGRVSDFFNSNGNRTTSHHG